MKYNIIAPTSPQEVINKVKFFQGFQSSPSNRKYNTIKQVAKKLFNGKGIAITNTNTAYQNRSAIFYWDGETIKIIATKISTPRATTLIKAIKNGTIEEVDNAIIENYINNGYTTRKGLFRSNDQINRCKKISESHDLILTPGLGGHNARVAYRNTTALQS